MHRYRPAWKSHSSHFFVAMLASSAIFTAGCANMATTAAVSDSLPSNAAAITGHVHGGNQPIAFATVTINTAGATAIGSAGSVLATTMTADDNAGSFSFIKDPTNGASHPSTGNTYSCPSTGDPLVYIKAVGGNTLNTHDNSVNNTASIFLAPLGRCSQINTSTFLTITEVTTAATVAALQQYIDPVAEVIGADGTGVAYQAITNSFNLVSSLANLSTGAAVTSTTFAGGSINFSNGVSTASVTATPEAAKINTIANIIAACVNTISASSTPCQTLFTNATPPAYSVTARPGSGTFNPATDVLQAAYFMFTNPTNGSTTNLANLYNLPSGPVPFSPPLSAIPTDWTVGISYSSASTCGTNAGSLIGSPVSLNVDTNGNLWIGNSQSGSGNLTEISSTGTPVVCLATNATTATNEAVATTIDQPVQPVQPAPPAPPIPAIPSNVWQGAASGLFLSRYANTTLTTVNFPLTEAPIALAADGIGNIYYSTAAGNLYQIPGAANAVPPTLPSPVLISSNPGFLATGLFVDDTITTPQTGAIWMTSNSGQISRTVPTTLTSAPAFLNGFTTSTFTTPSPTYGITTTFTVPGGTNNILTSISGTSNMVANLTGSGTSYASVATWPTTAGLGGLKNPTGIAIDGRFNIWTANNTTSGGLGSLSEISAANNALSPSTGFQKSSSYLIDSRAIVIDQSGNVWVGGDGDNFVTEIVGAAVPVFQPYSNGLFSGRFQTIP
jgi:hypothetical protein